MKGTDTSRSNLMVLPVALILTGSAVLGVEGGPHLTDRNLALGRPVVFAPSPNYALTSAGGTDATDLTDGKLSTSKTDRLWFDRNCVACSYAGQVQLSVDLGQVQPIEEVGLRLQGGSPQAGIALPPWVDVVVSTDGARWYRAASYSRWREDDSAKYAIPRDEGRAWVQSLRFRDLCTCGRYVGLALYCAAYTVSDELWILKGTHDSREVRFGERDRVAFTVDGVQMYFHKPVLQFSTNIHTPNPVGVIIGEKVKGTTATVELDLPAGVRLAGGRLGGTELGGAKHQVIRETDGEYVRYTVSCRAAQNEKSWGRLFLAGDWEDGRKGHLRWRLRWADRDMPWIEQPIQAVRIEPAPQPRRLTTGLGWYNIEATLGWPQSLTAFRTLGLNTVPLFARWVKPEDQARVGAFLDECRTQGFKIMNVDSPFHQMMATHRRAPEIYCQLEGGQHGDKMCPSYRGTFYREEIDRLADQTAKVKADFLSCDIELFGGVQTYAQKCSRCRVDFGASGCKDWNEWCLHQGAQMWMDLATAVRSRPGMASIEMGGYDFRPGANYQNIWPIDRLYPKFMQNTQVSTYTPLYPYHLELIGNEVRADRARLPRSDILPWLTPGDAGVFPGEMFRYALLECFANGARGLHFWSGRLWDTELLAAYARAIRNVAPVEDVIVEGDLLAGVAAEPAVRVSGMRRGNQMLLLVADYWKPSGTKAVKVTVGVEVESRIIDLDTGHDVALVKPGHNSFTIDLDRELARIFHVRPDE
jgi:hypothetical protein